MNIYKEEFNLCLAVPAKIISLEECMAKVDIMGLESYINIQLIDSPKIGELVLVHAGCAIEKIDAEYFSYLNEIFEDLLEETKVE